MNALTGHRLVTLDVGRGIASLCVVLFHWFLLFYVSQAGVPPQQLPLYEWLAPVYRNGWLGADFFFVLSGTIFFIRYGDSIADRSVTMKQFIVLRFSRLAPLHYATLAATALLQGIVFLMLGRFVVYREHLDGIHFLANLLFIQNWGFVPVLSDPSFNVPAWSLSVEALLYLLFFVLFRYLRPNIFFFALAAAAGMWLILSDVNSAVGRGLWCFFLSGGITWFYTRPSRIARPKPELFGAAVLFFLLLAFESRLNVSPLSSPLTIPQETASYIFHTGFFCALVACLVFSDRVLRRLAKPLSVLGDISYSTYLLHYPLQLALIACIVFWYGTFVDDIVRSPATLCGYFAVLISISWLSFRFIEGPAKKALRTAMLDNRPIRQRQSA